MNDVYWIGSDRQSAREVTIVSVGEGCRCLLYNLLNEELDVGPTLASNPLVNLRKIIACY